MEFKVGLDSVGSYKRLSYTPWHAIAEFIDNSTQSYFNNREILDDAFARESKGLEVHVVYERDNDIIRISDNSIGMSYRELEHALQVGKPPANSTGRSKFGMGLKTASCWLGNQWTLRTKKLGDEEEFVVTVDVDAVASGNSKLDVKRIFALSHIHGTTLEINKLHRKFNSRTSNKIKNFLVSMYRVDIRNNVLKLTWQGSPLKWEDIDNRILKDREGRPFKKPINFTVEGKHVTGWVAILGSGSRADAGFSIIQNDRVIKGWPDSWRPTSIFGQDQGSNDLINQRIFGEVHLDGFTVSHTKDSILWFGDEEEDIEKAIAKECSDYREIAKEHRKNQSKEGPGDAATQAAINDLKNEMMSPEMVDEITLIPEIPDDEAIDANVKEISSKVSQEHNTNFHVTIGKINPITVKVYLDHELSPNDPYVTIEASNPDSIIVIINQSHPHWTQLKDNEVLNYLRHCTYDAVAEWQSRFKASSINPNTIKLLKDKLLRVQYEIENNNVSSLEQGNLFTAS